MAIILSLETSSSICSVALHDNESLLVVLELHQEHAHASKLAVLIDKAIQLAGIQKDELGAVAVSCGPGSYTGLRIGTSTAKGLCYALSIPLVAVGTLDVMASVVSGFNIENAWLCPMMDARRMEVYCTLYDEDHKMMRAVEAKVIDEKSFQDELKSRRILFFGNGAMKCQNVIVHQNAVFIDGIYPSARQVGVLAARKVARAETEDLMGFEPFYLKDFVAKKSANLISSMTNKSE